ncbi:AGE family epimerase/isomerase [Georgenia daeguensis]|uniref:AGE family epimerase/isomerase n=1 Tax=Georgenia daeguensis TaxID=908355 RepID=A0ABP8EVN7_9MICO
MNPGHAFSHAPSRARRELEDVVMPFWLERGVDERHGGFHTCFDNRGHERTSTDKFTWSQGRFVWLLAHLADLARRGLVSFDADHLLAVAGRGARFLREHAILDDGTCRFRVHRDGSAAAEPPARSVYADLFAVMGLAELARVSGDPGWLEPAEPVLDRARRDILAGTAPTPPYEVPPGHRAFGPHLILLNTLVVHEGAARTLGVPGHADWTAGELDHVLGHQLPGGTFAEMVPSDADRGGTLVARHRVPGHGLEAVWVALEAAELLGRDDARPALLRAVAALCELGWDGEHGGLLRYTDADGPGRPSGASGGTPYEDLVVRTWDTKLWWVHSEASATTAIAAHRYGDPAAAEWFERIWRYTLETFPGGDEGAEWVQIRDRRAAPLDEVVALPVKDPFHVARNLAQIVALGDDDGGPPAGVSPAVAAAPAPSSPGR